VEELKTELDLVRRFRDLIYEKAVLSDGLKKINKKLMEIEHELYEALTAQDKQATATYEKLGYATLVKPAVRVSYQKERESEVFDYLREMNCGDMIKLTVNNKSLSSLVKKCLDEGTAIRDCIDYYLQPQVWLYDENGKRYGWSTNKEGEY
jgi:phosphoribosyl-ATP pyrophosphohydrolase